MTFIGKLFVLVNLAMSLMLATLAFIAYSAGIDWSNNAAKAGQDPGKIVPRKSQMDDLLKAQLPLAEQNWRSARKDLWEREDVRRTDREWYAKQLREVEEGKGPLQVVVRNKDGMADPGKGELPLVDAEEVAGTPLQPRKEYVKRIENDRAENVKIRADLEEKVKEDTKLTNELVGEGKKKGLRREVTEEREKRLGVVAEQGIVESLQINSAVDSELVLKRLESIDERVRELSSYLRVRHGVDVPAKWR